MQTFLPYRDFAESARVLDWRRLGKQRVEVLQILQALDLNRPRSRWANHPAVRMWMGYPGHLIDYGIAICDEWLSRGYRDTCYGKITALRWTGRFVHVGDTYGVPSAQPPNPPWLGDNAFHRAHRSNLVRKLPEHYGALWPDVPNDLPYIWPS